MSVWDVFWNVVVLGPPAIAFSVWAADELRFALWMRRHDVLAPRPPLMLTVATIPPPRGPVIDGELVEAHG
jgi:hypothetical protein